MAGWSRAVGTGAVCLGLLVAGSLFQDRLPDGDTDPGAAPHVRTGEVGDPIDLRTATVTVDEVLGSTRVDELGTELVSPGLWVVVRYTVVAAEENTPVTFAEFRDDDGRTWGLDGRNENSCTASPPGLAVRSLNSNPCSRSHSRAVSPQASPRCRSDSSNTVPC